MKLRWKGIDEEEGERRDYVDIDDLAAQVRDHLGDEFDINWQHFPDCVGIEAREPFKKWRAFWCVEMEFTTIAARSETEARTKAAKLLNRWADALLRRTIREKKAEIAAIRALRAACK